MSIHRQDIVDVISYYLSTEYNKFKFRARRDEDAALLRAIVHVCCFYLSNGTIGTSVQKTLRKVCVCVFLLALAHSMYANMAIFFFIFIVCHRARYRRNKDWFHCVLAAHSFFFSLFFLHIHRSIQRVLCSYGACECVGKTLSIEPRFDNFAMARARKKKTNVTP